MNRFRWWLTRRGLIIGEGVEVVLESGELVKGTLTKKDFGRVCVRMIRAKPQKSGNRSLGNSCRIKQEIPFSEIRTIRKVVSSG